MYFASSIFVLIVLFVKCLELPIIDLDEAHTFKKEHMNTKNNVHKRSNHKSSKLASSDCGCKLLDIKSFGYDTMKGFSNPNKILKTM